MTSLDHTRSVQHLFDTKAGTWGVKYSRGGALAWRIAAFRETLAACCAPPARVLDFGCGTGELAHDLAERGYDLAAADIAHSMLSRARERFGDSVRWNLLEPDWTRLPFDDQAFDAIVASSVLEYVGDTDAVLAEWARVLRHGGVLLVTVPNSRHPVRVLERLLAGTARSKAIGGVARLSDRIHAYFEYLRLSKNRYTRAKWHRVARDHGFCPLAPFPLPSGSLDLLGYHRS